MSNQWRVPAGTAIQAPAGALVAFAESGLHFEGGLTLLDHGQGLITAYLHQSKVLVKKGEVVTQGQVIGAVGKDCFRKVPGEVFTSTDLFQFLERVWKNWSLKTVG
jgi:septal ring factor EnvC (AmiA/AmiB activator)